MAKGEISNVSIKGITCCLPNNIVHIEDYYEQFGKELVDKVTELTGVKTKYVTKQEQCASDLVYIAAENLIKKLGWNKKSIGGLVFITQSPDYRKPSTACILQFRLGLSTDCVAFDVNLGCSGFIYGMWLCSQMMNNNDLNRVLLLIGDTPNKWISPHDHSGLLLSGDAGAAIALEKYENTNIRYLLKTDGSKFKSLYIPAGASRNQSANQSVVMNSDGIYRSDYHHYMNGLDIFQFTISEVPKAIKEHIQYFKLNIENFDYLLLHQANKFIVERIAKKVDFLIDRVPVNIDKYGNCGGTSIPLIIVDKLKDKLAECEQSVLMSGYGIGLSWGVMDLTLKSEIVSEIIFANDYFMNG